MHVWVWMGERAMLTHARWCRCEWAEGTGEHVGGRMDECVVFGSQVGAGAQRATAFPLVQGSGEGPLQRLFS